IMAADEHPLDDISRWGQLLRVLHLHSDAVELMVVLGLVFFTGSRNAPDDHEVSASASPAPPALLQLRQRNGRAVLEPQQQGLHRRIDHIIEFAYPQVLN